MDTDSDTIELESLMAHAQWVQRLAGALVGSTSEADDVVQETWLAAIRRPPQGSENLRAWLATVVRNVVRQRRRSGARRVRREARAASVREVVASPDDLAQAVETQRRIAAAVLNLPEPLRQTLLLRYYEGQNSVQIAQALDVPASTVRWRLARGLESLRDQLDEEFGDRSAWSFLLAPLGRIESPARAPISMGLPGALKGLSVMAISMKLVLPAAALAGWLAIGFWNSDGGGDVPDGMALQGVHEQVETQEPESIPSGSGTLATAQVRAEVRGELQTTVEGFGVLSIQVVDRETSLPVPACNVMVAAAEEVLGTSSSETVRRLTEPGLVTDDSGNVRVHLATGAELRLVVGGSTDHGRGSASKDTAGARRQVYTESSLLLAPLWSGEQRSLTVELNGQEFWGRLRDDADGRLLTAARVSHEPHSYGEPEESPLAVTEEGNGIFRFPILSESAQILWATARGYAPLPFLVMAKPGAREQPVELRLSKAVSLRVHVEGNGADGATVRLASKLYMDGEPSVRMSSFIHFRATCDQDGDCSFGRIPPGFRFEVSVQPAGEETRIGFAPITFVPGEQRSEDYRLRQLVTINGRLVDESGPGFANCENWLVRASLREEQAAQDGYFRGWDKKDVEQSCVTDPHGRFTFAGVSAGTWLVGPAAEPQDNRGNPIPMDPPKDWPAWAKRVELLPGVPEQEVVLELRRGLFIEGRILGTNGLGVAGIAIHASREGAPPGSVRRLSDRDGVFRVGPLLPGEHRLSMRSFIGRGTGGGACAPAPSTHLAGSSGVRLQLEPGRTLSCELTGVTDNTDRRIEVQLTCQEPPAYTATLSTYTDGKYSWSGLAPGKWSIYATDTLGNVWFAGGLEPSLEEQPAAHLLEPGVACKLRVRNKTAVEELRFRAYLGADQVGMETTPRGAVVELALPAGLVSIRYMDSTGTEQAREVMVAPGQPAEIELTPGP